MTDDRRSLLTLVATILASTVVFLDATVVNVALPAMEADLDAGLAGQQWIVEAYLLTLVSLLLVGGSLGDHFGRRRVFLVGLVGFGVTSVLCAVAPNTELLVASRAVQGFAGALLVPGSLAILTSTFEGEARGKAIGSWTAWSGISTVAGPAAGGFLVEELSWRWIFWLNVPLIAATILLTLHAVSESRDPDAVKGFDIPGVFLSALGLGGPVFALIEQPSYGWSDPLVWMPLVGGLILLAGFFVREARARAPMLPLGLFRIRNFAAANAATLTVYAGLYGGTFFLTLYLQQVSEYTPLEAGLAGVPVSLLLFALSSRFGALSARSGPRLPMTVGPLVAGGGYLLLLRMGIDANYWTEVLPGMILFGLGLAATVAPLTTTVLNSVNEHNAGIASGTNNAISRVAGLVAIAAIGAAMSGQFGSSIDSKLGERAKSGETGVVVSNASDRTLSGAGEADELPAAERATVGAAIAKSSRDAFRLGVLLAGGLMIIGGLTSAVWIVNERRRIERPAGPIAATAADCGPPGDEEEGRAEPVPGATERAPA